MRAWLGRSPQYDLWRASAPIDGPTWGLWPMGGAWLSLHLWQHYLYNPELTFLAKAYPVMRGAAQVFSRHAGDGAQARLSGDNPSLSPENEHPYGASVTAGPTMDGQILRDLLPRAFRRPRFWE